jgi:sulfoxide reductase heme-binding subunit YedZ
LSPRQRRLLHIAIVAALCAPALSLALSAWNGTLGANPIEKITHETGEWALRLLILTLAVTPLRRRFNLRWIAPLRRSFGLLAFFYASLHFLTYLVLDHFFDWALIVEDVLERRYVTVGFAAYLLLIPLALTSTRAMMRRLGARWTPLHRLIYATALLGALHFIWLVKADLLEPLLYAAVIVALLAYRIQCHLRRRPG